MPSPAPTPPRVLTPASGEAIGRAFRRLPAPFALGSASVEQDHVTALVCRDPAREGSAGARGGGPLSAPPSEQRCVEMRLDDPRRGCDAPPAGAFCVRFPAGAPSDLRSAVRAALAPDAEADIWVEPPAEPAEAPRPWRPSPGELSAALVLGPLLAGLSIGALVRRARRRVLPRAVSLAVLAAVPLGSILVATLRFRLGLWDVAEASLLFALAQGAVAGTTIASRPGVARLLVVAAALGIALACGEGILRRTVPRPYLIPPLDDDRIVVPRADLRNLDEGVEGDALFLSHRGHLDQCGYLHPELFPRHVDRYVEVPPGARKVVLQLGDSMTQGGGVDRRQAFPAVLERMVPDVAEINAGAQGMGPDFYFLVGKAWIDRMPRKPDLVVVNLFTGNDVEDMDQPMSCCRDGPILDYGPAGAVARCPEASWSEGEGESLGWFFRHSPPPYPLLYAAVHSDLAAWAVVGQLAVRRAGLPDKPSRDVQWAHLSAAIQALRDETSRRKIPLLAVILPLRQALEAPEPSATEGHAVALRMQAVCDALGVPALSPWDHLAALVKAEGSEALFLPPRDVHFTARGHEALAAWLCEPLLRRLDEAALPPGPG